MELAGIVNTAGVPRYHLLRVYPYPSSAGIGPNRGIAPGEELPIPAPRLNYLARSCVELIPVVSNALHGPRYIQVPGLFG